VSGLGSKPGGPYWDWEATLGSGEDLLGGCLWLVPSGALRHTINNQLRTGTDKGNLTV
jgi:hypothetical protein